MLDPQLLARDFHRHLCKLIDGHHFLRTNVKRPTLTRIHQAKHAFKTLVDIQERSGLFPVAPNLDLPALRGLGNFPADRRRRFLTTATPGTFGTKNVMEPGDMDFDAIVRRVSEIKPFAEKLIQAVLAVWF